MKMAAWAFVVMVVASGCSTRQPEAKPYQQSLLAKCPTTLPQLNDGEAGTILHTMADWASMYHECATRHNGLVDAIRK